jgi:phosphoserine phosphatase
MLEAAEQPIAFNPSEGLFKHAKESNWKIVIERKNIAYELAQKDGDLVLSDTTVFQT